MRQAHTHRHCIHQALSRAEQVCMEKGERLTPLRRHVLALVWKNHKPCKAYDLLEDLHDTKYSAKPPTIYRALEFLTALGLVHKIASANAFVGCSHAGECTRCYFMVCSACGEVEECCSRKLDTVLAHAAQTHRFQPAQMIVEMHGVCARCARKRKH